jgi:ubiquinone/menaquinone biosynthesis C-methylase UbiE
MRYSPIILLWRTYSDILNIKLLKRWMPAERAELLLKTDLFDEAVCDGLYPLLITRAKHVIGMDHSFSIVHEAQLRYPGLQMVDADVRSLPFPENTFDIIVSNSTLDHFESFDQMIFSLSELYRVLRKGGQLILTIDNLANPVIALRNWLPFRLLNRLGILPYYVGATCGPHQLRTLLEQVGFKLLEVDALIHCPRVLAVALARWMQKHTRPKSQQYFLRFLQAFEYLSYLPTRFFTGYFVAVKAMRH